jgi:hypothetical protein
MFDPEQRRFVFSRSTAIRSTYWDALRERMWRIPTGDPIEEPIEGSWANCRGCGKITTVPIWIVRCGLCTKKLTLFHGCENCGGASACRRQLEDHHRGISDVDHGGESGRVPSPTPTRDH